MEGSLERPRQGCVAKSSCTQQGLAPGQECSSVSPSLNRRNPQVPLGDLAVAPRAVLRWALGGTDGLGPLKAVALAATAPGPTCQGVGAAVHHDSVHAVGHGKGLEVALDGDR